MQEKKKQYILDDLLRIILAMFVLTVLFAFSCLLLSHGARGIWLAVLAQFTLLGVLGGVFLRRCLRIVQKNEQVMQLYAAGYTIADICHLKCYFSRGTEMALKKAVALLDTGKLLSVSKRQAQYLALQNQINPHFLFNMLNNANVLIKKNPEEASRVLFKLEDMLRYQINDSAKEQVLLSSEIHFLNDFLNLEKVRRDKFEYVISKEGDISEVWLPPLLFIPFVENAVKHNVDSENSSYVYLGFKVWDKQLEFQCINSKPKIALRKNEVGGLGLKNIKRRLELLFPERYTLEIEESEISYTVYLHLIL